MNRKCCAAMEWRRKWLERRPSEWPTLAAVRFIMALAVVVYHLPVVGGRSATIPYLGELGGLGCICGFLVISGYSIGHSITTQPKGFFARRAWRIMPVYYTTMALAILPYQFATDATAFRYAFPHFTTTELVGSVFFLQCFLTDKVPIFGPSWTLAVEWWLYMLAPLFVRLPSWLLTAIVVVSLVFQKEGLEKHGYFPVHAFNWGIPLMMLLWAWLSGFLFYRVRGWSAFLLVFVGYYATSRFIDLSPNAFLLAAVAVVVARSLPAMPRFMARFLNYLGDLSYPLYLVHVPLMAWVGRFTPWTDPYAFIGLALAAAAFLNHAVDIPLRSRFSPRRARQRIVAAPAVSA
jgi:peptidoglycan/LPS O-acetylase OafA/YrhL